MKFPEKIAILGRDIKIKLNKNPISNNELVDGYFSPGDKLIVINSDLSNEDKQRTLLHEIGHAVLNRVGFFNTNLPRDLEELIVENMASVIYENFELRVKRRGG